MPLYAEDAPETTISTAAPAVSVHNLTFRGMDIPDRFAYAIDLSFRFLPTVARGFGTTLDAQRARGFEIDKLRGGIFGKIARLAPMIIPVVIGSFVGAEDIINAMELRCFGVGRRSWLIELHTRPVDRCVIALTIAGFLAITALNILGNYDGSGFLHVLHTGHTGVPCALIAVYWRRTGAARPHSIPDWHTYST
jgi:energy-coupling factor transport system permease protein